MTHARTGNETLSVEQANILDRYLDRPNYVLPQFKRRFEAMARELTDLGFEEGYDEGYNSGYEIGFDNGYENGKGY